MSRRPRIAPGGLVYHVLNRAVARLALLEKEADYAGFKRVLVEALQEYPTRLLSYAVIPSHCHLVLWPRHHGEFTEFVRDPDAYARDAVGRALRYISSGHLYQGQFKSFLVETDDHFYTELRSAGPPLRKS